VLTELKRDRDAKHMAGPNGRHRGNIDIVPGLAPMTEVVYKTVRGDHPVYRAGNMDRRTMPGTDPPVPEGRHRDGAFCCSWHKRIHLKGRYQTPELIPQKAHVYQGLSTGCRRSEVSPWTVAAFSGYLSESRVEVSFLFHPVKRGMDGSNGYFAPDLVQYFFLDRYTIGPTGKDAYDQENEFFKFTDTCAFHKSVIRQSVHKFHKCKYRDGYLLSRAPAPF